MGLGKHHCIAVAADGSALSQHMVKVRRIDIRERAMSSRRRHDGQRWPNNNNDSNRHDGLIIIMMVTTD